jgi:molybdenum cofactor guanylyltransferase
MIAAADLTGLVLAGGRASRMGGVDKGLQPLGAMTLAQHAIARLAPQVGPLLISANRNPDRYRAYGHAVLADADPAAALGPLAGILGGLRAARTAYLLCVPCDLPFLPGDLAAALIAAAEASTPPAAIAYAASVDAQGELREHPACALIACRLADDLERYLEEGGRKVRAWYARHNPVLAKFDDQRAFYNINSLEELQRATRDQADPP